MAGQKGPSIGAASDAELLSCPVTGLSRTLDGDGATPCRNHRESRQNGGFCASLPPLIIKSAGEPVTGIVSLPVNGTVSGPMTRSGRTNRLNIT